VWLGKAWACRFALPPTPRASILKNKIQDRNKVSPARTWRKDKASRLKLMLPPGFPLLPPSFFCFLPLPPFGELEFTAMSDSYARAGALGGHPFPSRALSTRPPARLEETTSPLQASHRQLPKEKRAGGTWQGVQNEPPTVSRTGCALGNGGVVGRLPVTSSAPVYPASSGLPAAQPPHLPIVPALVHRAGQRLPACRTKEAPAAMPTGLARRTDGRSR